MPRSVTILSLSSFPVFLGISVLAVASTWMAARRPGPSDAAPRQAEANTLPQRGPACFVPNLGQWNHPAKFVHRSGPMTLFVQERGWVLDLTERPARLKTSEAPETIRGVALRMTFEGDDHVPKIVGGKKLPGHHNYFLGNDESRWQTHVPLYGSIRYLDLYPGIDVQVRNANAVPEYDLLLQPGADLSRVSIHVEGVEGLSIAADGALVMETALGPVVQPKPKTWQVDGDGRRREVVSRFVLLGADRFGFEAPGWDRDTRLTIDPPLIWSTFLGGSDSNYVDTPYDVAVDASGMVTVAGKTHSADFPTSLGAYDTTFNSINRGVGDAFVSRLDPSKTGAAQLIYSTFLGGSGHDTAYGLAVDARGVVTVAGTAGSSDFPFPPKSSAYDTTFNGTRPGDSDAFVSRLDPSKTGTAQLVYSTFLGGACWDDVRALAMDVAGVVTVAGNTTSADFPTTQNAYDTTHNSPGNPNDPDIFVSRLDLGKTGAAQLVYSTFLGGRYADHLLFGSGPTSSLAVDPRGIVTVAGHTYSPMFPTKNAYQATHSKTLDIFVSRLDPSKTPNTQLVYSTFLGGNYVDYVTAVSVDPRGIVTVAGLTGSSDFPTKKAFSTKKPNPNGPSDYADGFISRLDPSKTGGDQLVYSTFFGGTGVDGINDVVVDANGVVTATGYTNSTDFPTKGVGAYTKYNGGNGDAFVSRLDPSKTGTNQLLYSTYLGGYTDDAGNALVLDAVGVVTVVGTTGSNNFPTVANAWDNTHNGGWDVFASRLSMGTAFYADRYELRLSRAGTQKLQVDAGTQHAGRHYAIFGSVTGTTPGILLPGVQVPLNFDAYTQVTLALPTLSIFASFRGVLDRNGEAQAAFHVPAGLPPSLMGFTLHHAYLVFDNNGQLRMASNPVPLKLVR